MESIKKLRKICQSTAHQEHPGIRFYRLFSIYTTKILLILGAGPTFVSALSFFFRDSRRIFIFKRLFYMGQCFILWLYDFRLCRWRSCSLP